MTPEELFEQNKHLAECTIYKMFKNPRKIAKDKRMELDDIFQYAYEGLWKGCQTWQESKSQFNTFAINNIKWHVMVKLRDDDNYKYCKSKPNSKENNINLEYMDNTLKDDSTMTFHDVVPSCSNVFDVACGNVLAPQMLDTLTDRQREALLLKAKGYTYEEVGQRLGISKQASQKLLRNVNYRIGKIKNLVTGVI